ncbi:Hcp family type VI secretion system effector [Pseudomonas sp. GD04058]|uniref:Hcp family type VI secretion system effector n=1 Tax=Pseudomonas sp. GD04058 TaxID=2975429 RepID=UPI002448F826|nr:Hcp family type VI secretion system effector [Pseudomonas sp. GD04058]MDG9885195.1 Hcp family type VI secretion system effector [Pseudomonas sp. GD04058]
MANHSYMRITGPNSGLISAGCSTQASIGNLCQAGHTNQILVLSMTHAMSSVSNVSSAVHNPLVIHKLLDKSSPLLAKAMTDREDIECEIDLYRTAGSFDQKYYTIVLKGARIVGITLDIPNVLMFNDALPTEQVVLRYHSITWTHHIARTDGYAFSGLEE